MRLSALRGAEHRLAAGGASGDFGRFLQHRPRGIHAVCAQPGTTNEVCPSGNTFVANQMLGNGLVDARDDTGIGPGGTTRPLQNTWVANECATDLPDGAICDVG